MQNHRNEESIMGREVELYTLMHDIFRNIVFIILGALAAAMLSYVIVNIGYKPQYTTSTTFVVGAKDSNSRYSNLNSANEMAITFQKVLESNVMKKMICETMEVEEIDAVISAEVLEGTNLLVLSVTDDTAKEAIDIIRVIMDNYSDIALYTVGNAVMEILEEPKVPSAVANPMNAMDVAKKGFLLGALICMFLFGFLSYMRNSVKREEDIEKKLDARSLGAISYEQKYKTLKERIARRKGSILVDNPISSFPFVENYKKLASKVEYQMDKDNGKVLVVTSVSENEGKSTVAANLALTLANQGKKVILVDGDIRRPSQFLILNQAIEEKNELGEFLKDTGNMQDILVKTSRKNLYFLGGRNCYSSSTDILQSKRLEPLLVACRRYADFIIIDTPPAGLLGDAQLFALSSDAVLMVVRQNFMLAEDINDVIDDFRINNIRVLGVVLNGEQTFTNIVDTSAKGRYGSYGHYKHYSKDRG